VSKIIINKREQMNLNDLIVIGDVHGKWPMLKNACDKFSDKTVLCVGDLGLGFPGRDPNLPANLRFIRGNHDRPDVCKAHPQYALDYGMWNGVFLLAGASSIDKSYRTPGVDWWPDEELSIDQMELALQAYAEAKPDIVICHEAPFALHKLYAAASCTHDRNNNWGEPRGNDTAFLLDKMISFCMPKMVIHGHWHNPLIYKQWGCVFVSLGELETFDLCAGAKFFGVKWRPGV